MKFTDYKYNEWVLRFVEDAPHQSFYFHKDSISATCHMKYITCKKCSVRMTDEEMNHFNAVFNTLVKMGGK